MMLESVTRFIFDNIGNQLSTKKIADTMTSAGRKNRCKKQLKNIWLHLWKVMLYIRQKDIISRKTIFKNIGKILCC